MSFVFSPCWVHKLEGDKVKSLICQLEADFKVLIQGGYTNSPKAAKEKTKHPAFESYFDTKGSQKVAPEEIKTDLTIEEVEELTWPKLKAYAKKLEGLFSTDIVSKHSKKDDVILKIKELRNANSTSTDK